MEKQKILRQELSIASVRDDTPDTKTFRFLADVDYIPGQYFIISYKTLKEGMEKEIKRSYSLSSSPTEKGFLDFTIKLYPQGEFTPLIFSKKPGEKFGLLGPIGKFVFDENCKKVAFLGAGSGITPLRSMMKYCIDKKLPIDLVLLYSSKTPQDIIFREEFEVWNSIENVNCVNTITRPDGNVWEGQTGRISTDLVKKHVDVESSNFYICGPPEFVSNMVNILRELKVPEDKIRKEQWD